MDSHGQPLRLGERDSAGHLVGYIDQQGFAWESLIERMVAIHGQRLAEAMALPDDDPHVDHRIDEALADLRDKLIGEVVREAAGQLEIKQHGRRLLGDNSG